MTVQLAGVSSLVITALHLAGGYLMGRCGRALWFIARSDDRAGKQTWFDM